MCIFIYIYIYIYKYINYTYAYKDIYIYTWLKCVQAWSQRAKPLAQHAQLPCLHSALKQENRDLRFGASARYPHLAGIMNRLCVDSMTWKVTCNLCSSSCTHNRLATIALPQCMDILIATSSSLAIMSLDLRSTISSITSWMNYLPASSSSCPARHLRHQPRQP